MARRLGFWRRLAVVVLKPPLTVLTKRDWRGMEHVPSQGGLILVANHISEFDPLVAAHFVYDAGRWPQFLAKSSLFKIKLFGSYLHTVKQIPVERGTADAAKALDAAISAVRSGDAVIVYPEGTTTKDEQLWPRRGKTGVARIWLATGAPVVPFAMWGPQRVMHPTERKIRLRPRTPITVLAGPPVDLSQWAGAQPTTATVQEITEKVMACLRALLAEARQEPAPAEHAVPSSGRAQPAPGFGGGDHAPPRSGRDEP